MEDLLKMLMVIQERKIKHRLGRQVLMRLNPFNPLTYIVMIISFIVGTILYGVVGYWSGFKNPFKYR